MTKPRKGKGHKMRVVRARLDARQQRVLAQFLWPEEESSMDAARMKKLVQDVEAIMSLVSTGASVDNGPRAAGQRAALVDVLRMGRALHHAIKDLPSAAWEELEREFDIYKLDPLKVDDSDRRLVLELAELARAAEAVCQRLSGVESRGRQPAAHRNFALIYLVRIFHDVGNVPKRDYRGHAKDFVHATLRIAGLDAPESDEKFWKLVPKELHKPRPQR